MSILVWGKRELVALLCDYCVALPRGDIGMSPWGGGGGTLIFHTYVGSAHYFGFKILNFNIFWGFSENGGMSAVCGCGIS